MLSNFTTVFPPYHSHDHGSHEHHHHHGPSLSTRLSRFFRRQSAIVTPIEAVQDNHDHHQHEDEESFRQKLNDLADELKAVDGIDETANLVGQIFPGLAAPIATATILAIATPFVFLGIIGMKHEYEQAKEELKEILASQKTAKEKLQELSNLSNSRRQLLNERLQLDLEATQPRAASTGIANDNEFLQQIYQAEMIANRGMILAISKQYGWSGILGMSGMFAGMIPATISAGFEIAKETANEGSALATTMEACAHIAHQVAGSLFLVGQVAMSIYAAGRGVAGAKGRKILENSQTSFEDFLLQFQGDEEVARAGAAVLQIFKKKQYFLDKTSIEYAKLTVAGQIFMGAGTICGLSGAGLTASIPLFAIGAPLTIYPAIKRIVAQKKNENFSGVSAQNCQFIANFTKQNSIAKMLEARSLEAWQENTENTGEDKLIRNYRQVFTETAKKLNVVNENLAELKVISLVLHLVNDKKYQSKNPQRKLEILKEKLKINKENNSLKSSNLEEGVVALAKEHFRQKEAYILAILQKTRPEASKKLITESLQRVANLSNLDGVALPQDLQDAAKQKELIISLGIEDVDKLESDSIATINKFSRKVVNCAKAAAKVARDNLADNMVTIPTLCSMRNQLLEFERELEQQTQASASEPSTLPQVRGGSVNRGAGVRLAPVTEGIPNESVA